MEWNGENVKSQFIYSNIFRPLLTVNIPISCILSYFAIEWKLKIKQIVIFNGEFDKCSLHNVNETEREKRKRIHLQLHSALLLHRKK